MTRSIKASRVTIGFEDRLLDHLIRRFQINLTRAEIRALHSLYEKLNLDHFDGSADSLVPLVKAYIDFRRDHDQYGRSAKDRKRD